MSLRTISFGPTGLRGYNCLCWYVGHNLFANDIIIGFVLMDKTAIRNLYCFFFNMLVLLLFISIKFLFLDLQFLFHYIYCFVENES